jgi:hypothetical protein
VHGDNSCEVDDERIVLLCSPAAIDYRLDFPDFFRRFHNLLPVAMFGLPMGCNLARKSGKSESVNTLPTGKTSPIANFSASRRTVSRWQPIAAAAVEVVYSIPLLWHSDARRQVCGVCQ